ncbi:leucine efflux protein [Betaproteobacteria bacterium]|nr:leucine efflux protein [Betaproteobacteria bacterium]GHT97440.1 leucine efflux protein [Betaproteobacteria bacterium]GHU00479.1 leucine efflux protein [Betaproteobacteria bacterium]GHU06955.1 leucine efflux protein [Betaproteobacteria bacterium]GHU28654.1 leucine efflux protein [Betaproteobacteria bacterium]
MFDDIIHLGTFIVGTIFIVLVPGPNSLYVFTVASRRGIAAGYRGAGGIFTGDAILMLLAASGAASVLKATPALFTVLRYAGALYLVWLGIDLLRAAWAQWRSRTAPATTPPLTPLTPFRTALLISLLNPKAILFFVSFFIQFVSPQAARPALAFLILGAIVQFFSMLYLTALIMSGAKLALWFNHRRWLTAAATGMVGSLFIAFGLRLTTALPG